MKVTKIVAFTMAATLLLGGVAAVGAATPADGANGTATDASADASETPDNETETDASGSVGPSDGLPTQVPDHVSGIHDRIESFLNGSIDDLGTSLSEFLGGEQADAAADEHASGESGA